MDQSNIDAIYNLLDSIKVTKDNEDIIYEVKEHLEDGDYMEALAKLQLLTDRKRKKKRKVPEEEKHETSNLVEEKKR